MALELIHDVRSLACVLLANYELRWESGNEILTLWVIHCARHDTALLGY